MTARLSALEMSELRQLIRDMDVPRNREIDWRWLNRNLPVSRPTHPALPRVMILLRTVLRTM